jgi:hypothetical protein
MAMYQAKEAGKNAWRIYRSDLDASLQNISRMSWNDRILHRVENAPDDASVPGHLLDGGPGQLSHFEVLVRMRDKDDPDAAC